MVGRGSKPTTKGRRPSRLSAAGWSPHLGPTPIEASQSVGEAAFAILRRHYAAFLAREPGTRHGKDPEDLHQMRVATRRLRAAMALFHEVLPLGATRLRQELAWIGAVLGHVRDVDVQLDRVRAWLADAKRRDRAALRPLAPLLREQRALARIPLLRVLDCPRYRRFVAAYTALLRRGPLRRRRAAGQPVLAIAPDLIARRYRAVRKAGDRISEASSPATLHALRIKCKRLRYAVEFFAPLYGKPAEAMAKRAAAVQDILGMQQDAQVALRTLRRMCERRGRRLPPRTLFALGQAAQHFAQQAAEARAEFPEAYREVAGKRWKRLRRAMEAARPTAPPTPH